MTLEIIPIRAGLREVRKLRYIAYYQVTPFQSYPLLKSQYCLMYINLKENLGEILNKHKYWQSTEKERRELFHAIAI
jgi:hypothetical protein